MLCIVVYNEINVFVGKVEEGKVIPLHAREALGVRGGIAPSHF
jgi:hypothetical protein